MTPEPEKTVSKTPETDRKTTEASQPTAEASQATQTEQPVDPTLTPGDEDTLPGGSVQTGQPETMESREALDWRGWLLVGVVFLSFVVIPLIVLYIPEAHWFIGALGFSQRQAYIVFPMLPAILLGLTAVWAAVRSQSPSS